MKFLYFRVMDGAEIEIKMEVSATACSTGPFCRAQVGLSQAHPVEYKKADLEYIGLSSWLCGSMDKASYYKSGDYRFKSCYKQQKFWEHPLFVSVINFPSAPLSSLH